VNVIKEDIQNPNLLFVGTEYGFFTSVDGGTQWKKLMNNLPVVRIDDVIIHPRERDLILASHGRSVWIMDDISPLEQLTPAVQAMDMFLFDPRSAVEWINDAQLGRGRMLDSPAKTRRAVVAINYYLKAAPSGQVEIKISDTQGDEICAGVGTRNVGLNQVRWAFGP